MNESDRVYNMPPFQQYPQYYGNQAVPYYGGQTGGYVPIWQSGALALLGAPTISELQPEAYVNISGSKPIVVCGGVITEAKDLDDAQRIAEEQAHARSADAYILKPIKRVAPKRDVVTTELP